MERSLSSCGKRAFHKRKANVPPKIRRSTATERA
nr:MAG TPA: hypothetical protein [Caudoviricetes sp.]